MVDRQRDRKYRGRVRVNQVTGRYSWLISRWLGPCLWYDLCGCGEREESGSWSGSWEPLSIDCHIPSREEAQNLFASHPLAAPWAEAISEAQEPAGIDDRLFLEGPRLLVTRAIQTVKVLGSVGQPALVGGSLAMWLQKRFRLSLDIDLSLPDRLLDDQIATSVQVLTSVGWKVTKAKSSYIGAMAEGVTLDIEAGYAYGQQVTGGHWDRAVTVAELPCISAADLINLKRRSDRAKDRADLHFLGEMS